MRDGFLRLRLNEGAIKARVKSDTSANNWPMNAQFFFSSYVTCHATSWTRTPSGGGSRGTKDKLQRLRQITLCLSPCTDPATIASCSNKSLRVYWRNFVKILVFATEFCRRDKSHKILSDLIFCNLLLRQNSVGENPKIL